MELNLCISIFFLSLINCVLGDCGCGADRSKSDDNSPVDSESVCSVESTKDNNVWSTSEIIENMALIPKGNYQLGTNDVMIENDKEGPMQYVDVEAFYLDKFEVSNQRFYEFTQKTGYKTEAEVFGDSFVFSIFLNNTFKVSLKDFRVVNAPWWYKVTGANWQHPYGPDSSINDIPYHPVVHVSWNDAQAFCKWRGGRLPTEMEWEAACRGGRTNTKYPWGDKLFPDRKHMANLWQGTFPTHNSEKDGFIGTNPVDMFPQNEFGLYNIAGNVWEWTENTWDDKTPNEKVKKGGSYLCHKSYCYRYRCSARSHNTDDSSAGNLGFRCAMSV